MNVDVVYVLDALRWALVGAVIGVGLRGSFGWSRQRRHDMKRGSRRG